MDRFTENRRFIYALTTVIICCVFWWFMRYDAATLKDIIGAVSLAFLASEAASNFAPKQNGKS